MKRKPKTITGLDFVKRKRKQKTCQWLEGFQCKSISGWHTCHFKATFEIQYKGVTVAHVCALHGLEATLKGWQIR